MMVFCPELLCCLFRVLISSIDDLLTYLFASFSMIESNLSAHISHPVVFISVCDSQFLGDAQGTGSGTILKMGERTS